MGDRYFKHIVGCLESSIKTAEDGVDTHLSVVTIQGAVDLLKEQQAKIERLQPKWIPVSERLPKDGERVLAITESGNQFVGFHTQFSGWHFEYVIHPTHWMPLPEPPMMD